MQCSFRGRQVAGKETVVMARPSKYAPEFRRRAIEEVLDRERTVTGVARALIDAGLDNPTAQCRPRVSWVAMSR